MDDSLEITNATPGMGRLGGVGPLSEMDWSRAAPSDKSTIAGYHVADAMSLFVTVPPAIVRRGLCCGREPR